MSVGFGAFKPLKLRHGLNLGDNTEAKNAQEARLFLRAWLVESHKLLESWLAGTSRKNFEADLILMRIGPDKKEESYDLTGINLGYAVSLFEKLDGGYIAAKRVVEHNQRCGKPVPQTILQILARPEPVTNEKGPSAKYGRRNLVVALLLKILQINFGLKRYLSAPTADRASNRSEIESVTAIAVIKDELAPFSATIRATSLASLERAARDFKAKNPWF